MIIHTVIVCPSGTIPFNMAILTQYGDVVKMTKCKI